MKYLKISLMTFALLGLIVLVRAQNVDFLSFWSANSEAPRQELSAIFHQGKALVTQETPDGPIKLDIGTKGLISVSTIQQSGCSYGPVKAVGFKVAIQTQAANGLWMYSEKTFYEVNLEDITRECRVGDRIILMTVDKRYQLSRHEIEVTGGC